MENFFFVGMGAKMPKNLGGGLCINPSYEPVGDKGATSRDYEGCLSLPGRLFWQMRYPVILATWTNTQGYTHRNVKLKHYAARVFQHEYDHLMGKNLLETSCGELIREGKDTL